MKIYRNLVAPGYFTLMKIPLVEGRDFTMQDDDPQTPRANRQALPTPDTK